MKIGILTYHRAHNYGAMLQAYALRTTLRHNKHNDVQFIGHCRIRNNMHCLNQLLEQT